MELCSPGEKIKRERLTFVPSFFVPYMPRYGCLSPSHLVLTKKCLRDEGRSLIVTSVGRGKNGGGDLILTSFREHTACMLIGPPFPRNTGGPVSGHAGEFRTRRRNTGKYREYRPRVVFHSTVVVVALVPVPVEVVIAAKQGPGGKERQG